MQVQCVCSARLAATVHSVLQYLVSNCPFATQNGALTIQCSHRWAIVYMAGMHPLVKPVLQ